jgi:hypothetical protein
VSAATSPRLRALLLRLADALGDNDGNAVAAGRVCASASDQDGYSDLHHLGLVGGDEGGYTLTSAGYAFVQGYDRELDRVGCDDSPSSRDVDAREPMLAALEADKRVEYRSEGAYGWRYSLTDLGRERFDANGARDARADALFVAGREDRCAS